MMIEDKVNLLPKILKDLGNCINENMGMFYYEKLKTILINKKGSENE